MKTTTPWRDKLNKKQEAKIVSIPPDMRKRLGHGTMVIPQPLEVEALIRKIPRGKLMTPTAVRNLLARKYHVDAACPLTTGAFVRMVAKAAEEDLHQGRKRVAPYWRIVKENGALIDTFPGGVIEQSMRLLGEGHTLELGKRRAPPRIKDFEERLAAL
jgi:hypothetical protein